ncbi:hypothetical protein QNO08_14815 [Arthrobacter sp. zg-Y820]|uniref:hypothetical protein n=1 Tax=unclassified Arthrobacter TaxID=235627 RepID=UPI001E395CF6|nr:MULTISPECIES: hypothetical protein [unclassified Arthrobacter]MCC9195619.1 hypothetical protein [Arthrobacter sp. zg-Y820]MDK1278478.1 hypothetical protein [Arthrobacter sp. zg.Y820]WIB09085.1 hypothetical protein QNO08_14815 [Arthrobacter sp. zg-Y820]
MSVSSDTRCVSFTPGHNVHLIHGKKLAGFDDWVDARAYADVELDLIQLIVDGEQQLMWFHDIPALALALAHSGGEAQWCARYSSLLVPGGFDSPARRSFFYLATPERVHPCKRIAAGAGAAAQELRG